MLNDIRYNPYLTFYFDLMDILGKSLPEDFLILNGTGGQFIPRKEKINKRVTDIIDLKILYKCNDTINISASDECIPPTLLVNFNVNYTLFNLDHQNSTSPLYIMKDKLLGYTLRLIPDETLFITETWEIVKYNPEAGLTKLWNNLNGIDIEQQKYIGIRYMNSYFKNYKLNSLVKLNETVFRLIGGFEYFIDFNHNDEYTRTKKSFLDLISSVFSLCLGVFNFLTVFLTGFYSNNFDNYKIVEKILYNIKNVKSEQHAKIEIPLSTINENSLLDEKEREKDLNNDDEENKNLGNENLISDINETEKEDTKKRILPKLRFIDFIFNNFSNICKNRKSNRQDIISKCNNLISKYYSIETVLYNQIKMENLLKDYKWNNPDLANINNNELIIQLNNSISSFNIE